MKRDWDLLRQILLKIEHEASPVGITSFGPSDFPESDWRTVYGHFQLLHQRGLIDCSSQTIGGNSFSVRGLTWEGHETMDAFRDPKIWAEVREQAVSVTSGATVEVLKALAVGLIKTKIKQHTGIEVD